jgi:hypothetical protein
MKPEKAIKLVKTGIFKEQQIVSVPSEQEFKSSRTALKRMALSKVKYTIMKEGLTVFSESME